MYNLNFHHLSLVHQHANTPVQRPPLDLVNGQRGETNTRFIPFELCRERHAWSHHRHQHGRQLHTETVLKNMKITIILLLMTTAVTEMRAGEFWKLADTQEQLCQVEVGEFWWVLNETTSPTLSCCHNYLHLISFYDKLRLSQVEKWSFKLSNITTQLKKDPNVISLLTFTTVHIFPGQNGGS